MRLHDLVATSQTVLRRGHEGVMAKAVGARPAPGWLSNLHLGAQEVPP